MSDIDEPMIRFELLGPLRAWRGDVALELGPSQQRVVLAVLLLHANRSLGREGLIEAVWGPVAPAQAVNMLQKHISGLRRVLEPVQQGRPTSRFPAWNGTGYFLTVPAGNLDLQVFDALVGQARAARVAGDLARAAEAFHAALREWRGTPFDGLTSPLLDSERSQLIDRQADVVEDRIEVDLALGRDHDLVAELRHLVAAHPFRERMHSLLMLALHQSGRRAEALAAFRHARRHLHDELGVEPSTQVQQLHQRILSADPTLDPTKAAVPTASGTPQVEVRPLPSAAYRGPSVPDPPVSVTASQLIMIPDELAARGGEELATLTRDRQPQDPKLLQRELRGIWMAPPLDRMVERPELGDRLIAALTAPGAGDVGLTTGLAGVGGFGKTTLAAWVCRRPEIRKRYPGGLLWVSVGQELRGADLAEKINDLAFALCGRRQPISDPDVAGAELGRLLDERESVLLVVDDVWDEQQLRPFRFGGQACTRLVTTRIPGLLPPGGTRIRVDAMSQKQARQLVTDGVTGLPATASKQLAVAAGKWPVLLNLINGVLRQRMERGQQSAEAAAEIVRRLAAKGPAAFDPARPADRSRAVAATVEASLVLLDSADRDRYFDLAIFPEDIEIPLDVLRLLWPAGLVDTLCDELTGLGLVAEYRLDEPEPRLVLHDVMRAYLYSCREPASRTDAHRRLVAAAADLLPPYDPDGPVPWWLLPANTGYLWRFLPYHLHEAGASDEVAALACDLRWIAAKARRLGSVVGTIADLDLVDASVAKMSRPQLAQEGKTENIGPAQAGEHAIVRSETAVALRRLIEQSAHLLRPNDPQGVLEATLVSRAAGIAGLADALSSTLTRPYLAVDRTLPDHSDPSLYRVLIRGRDPVSVVRFSPDGGTLASAGADGVVRLWDPVTGGQRHLLTGHHIWVTCIAFSSSGDLLVSASEDGMIQLWDTVSGSLQHTLVGHQADVTAVAFHPRGHLVASTGEDGIVRLWETASGEALQTLAGHSTTAWQVEFSPDGEIIASVSADGTIRIRNARNGMLMHTLTGHDSSVQSIAFSPDSSVVVSGARNGTLRLWDVATGALRHSFGGHMGWVRSVCFSPDGRSVASASWDRTARVWDVSTGACLRVFDNHLLSAEAIMFSPDGSVLASTAGDGTIHIWDPLTGEERCALSGHTKSVPTIAFSPDGGYLASGSWDGSVRLWRLTSVGGDSVASGSAVVAGSSAHTAMTAIACSPDGQFLATSGANGIVCLYGETLEPKNLMHSVHGKPVCAISFGPDGKSVASGGADGAVVVWPVGSRAAPRRFTGHAVTVRAVSFSPDGLRLLSAGDDGVVRIWHAMFGHPITAWSGGAERIMAVAWSPDGRMVATAGDDGIVRLQDAATGAVVRNLTALAVAVKAVAFDPTGLRIAAGGTDGVLRLWQLTSGESHSLVGHELTVEAVAFHPDGAYVASAGHDGTVRLWAPSTGTFVAGIRVDDSLSGLTWTPDRRRIIAVGGRGMYWFACVEGPNPDPLTSLARPAVGLQ